MTVARSRAKISVKTNTGTAFDGAVGPVSVSKLESSSGVEYDPLVIAHRGACGKYPSHTRLAYEEGAQYGDFIECDLAITKDLVLICLHDSWLSATTNISSAFPASRKKTRFWDNKPKNDYFSVDFTWEELQKIGKNQERSYRDQEYNGQPLASFQEYLDIAVENRVGIYPETKNSDDFNKWLLEEAVVPGPVSNSNRTFEDLLIEEIYKNEKFFDSGLPCFYQSFQLESIVALATKNSNSEHGYGNANFIYLQGSPPSNQTLTTLLENGITGLGLSKKVFVPEDSKTGHMKPINRDLLQNYLDLGFTDIHVYTMRNEYNYLVFEYEQDFAQELQFWKENFPEVSGYFTDFPKSFRNFLEAAQENECSGESRVSANLRPGFFSSLLAMFAFQTMK